MGQPSPANMAGALDCRSRFRFSRAQRHRSLRAACSCSGAVGCDVESCRRGGDVARHGFAGAAVWTGGRRSGPSSLRTHHVADVLAAARDVVSRAGAAVRPVGAARRRRARTTVVCRCHAQEHVSTMITRTDQPGLLLCNVAGFLLAFKGCLTFLFFRSNPQAGAGATVGLTLCWLLLVAGLHDPQPTAASDEPNEWEYAAVDHALSRTGCGQPDMDDHQLADSRRGILGRDSRRCGCHLVAVALSARPGKCGQDHAWVSSWGRPCWRSSPGRLPRWKTCAWGNEEFLHPNLIGFDFAIAALFSAYLAQQKKVWSGQLRDSSSP